MSLMIIQMNFSMDLPVGDNELEIGISGVFKWFKWSEIFLLYI